MTSPIIYETFDQWFHEQEGYSLRSERAEGEIEWLKAAFEAGRAGALSQAASAAYVPLQGYVDDLWNGGNPESVTFRIVKEAEQAIRKLGEDK